MDPLTADTQEDRLIEDYLFRGYRPDARKSAFELDQNFAKPIEDEDLFGLCEQKNSEELDPLPFESTTPQNEDAFANDIYADEEVEILHESINSGSIFDDELDEAPSFVPNVEGLDIKDDAPMQLDDIFIDDYSNSQEFPNENIRPEKTYPGAKQMPPPPPSPAQIKLRKMKEKILQQALAKQLKPKKIGSDFGDSGVIDVVIEQHRLVSDSNSKFIFNKLFNKSKKANDHGVDNTEKLHWKNYKQVLRKQICTQKRKVWDSFQHPVDNYDDEEEIIEERTVDEEKQTSDSEEKINDEAISDDGSQGFEDLEREELGSDCEEEEDDVVRSNARPPSCEDATSGISEDQEMADEDEDELLDEEEPIDDECNPEIDEEQNEDAEELEDGTNAHVLENQGEEDESQDSPVSYFLNLEAETDSAPKHSTQRRKIVIDDDSDDDQHD